MTYIGLYKQEKYELIQFSHLSDSLFRERYYWFCGYDSGILVLVGNNRYKNGWKYKKDALKWMRRNGKVLRDNSEY